MASIVRLLHRCISQSLQADRTKDLQYRPSGKQPPPSPPCGVFVVDLTVTHGTHVPPNIPQGTAIRPWEGGAAGRSCSSEASSESNNSTTYPGNSQDKLEGIAAEERMTVVQELSGDGHANNTSGYRADDSGGQDGLRNVKPLSTVRATGSDLCVRSRADGGDCFDIGDCGGAEASPVRRGSLWSTAPISSKESAAAVSTERPAIAVEVPAAAGERLNGKVSKGLLGRGRRRRVGHGSGKPPPRDNGRNIGDGRKVASLGGKRRSCLEVELVDWIEANTNLVNVSPW